MKESPKLKEASGPHFAYHKLWSLRPANFLIRWVEWRSLHLADRMTD